MGTVYVIQEAMRKVNGEWRRIHDLTPALVYGKIKIIVTGDQHLPISIQPIIWEFKKKLKDFSDDDYLLLVGDPILIGIATAVASDINNGVVNFLKWDREASAYLEIPADLHK